MSETDSDKYHLIKSFTYLMLAHPSLGLSGTDIEIFYSFYFNIKNENFEINVKNVSFYLSV